MDEIFKDTSNWFIPHKNFQQDGIPYFERMQLKKVIGKDKIENCRKEVETKFELQMSAIERIKEISKEVCQTLDECQCEPHTNPEKQGRLCKVCYYEIKTYKCSHCDYHASKKRTFDKHICTSRDHTSTSEQDINLATQERPTSEPHSSMPPTNLANKEVEKKNTMENLGKHLDEQCKLSDNLKVVIKNMHQRIEQLNSDPKEKGTRSFNNTTHY